MIPRDVLAGGALMVVIMFMIQEASTVEKNARNSGDRRCRGFRMSGCQKARLASDDTGEEPYDFSEK